MSPISLEMSALVLPGLARDIYPGTQMALTTIISVILSLLQAHSTPNPAGNTTKTALCALFLNFCATETGTKWEQFGE